MKAMIFDFDGVIANTEKPTYKLVKKMLKKYGIEIKNREEFKGLYDNNFYKTVEAKGLKGKKLQKFKEESAEELKKIHSKYYAPIPNIIKELSLKYYLAIVSSNFREVIVKKLEKDGLMKCFSMIRGAEKENSKIYKIKKVIENYGILPKEAIYVTDTLGDLKEAKKAKVKTIAVTWGFHTKAKLKMGRPNFILNDPKELLEIK